MNRRTGIAAIAVTAIALSAGTTGAIAATATPSLGMASSVKVRAYTGYYDSHKDTFLALNASTKAAATALHLTFAPALAGAKAAPPMYLFQGAAAAGQIPMFGLTEPGKAGYTPLWEELIVTWRAGVTPTLFKVDDDITLEDQGAATGTRLVTAYPHSFPAATLCYVWVNAGAPGAATVSAAVFAAGPAP